MDKLLNIQWEVWLKGLLQFLQVLNPDLESTYDHHNLHAFGSEQHNFHRPVFDSQESILPEGKEGLQV